MAGFAHTLLHLVVGCHLRIGSDAGIEHDIGLGVHLSLHNDHENDYVLLMVNAWYLFG